MRKLLIATALVLISSASMACAPAPSCWIDSGPAYLRDVCRGYAKDHKTLAEIATYVEEPEGIAAFGKACEKVHVHLKAGVVAKTLADANSGVSLRAAEQWCTLHPDARESGDMDEHLISVRECANWFRNLRWAKDALTTPVSTTPGTCSGELEWVAGVGYVVATTCHLSVAVAKEVLKVCAVGQQCEVTGYPAEGCNDEPCMRMTHLISASRGKDLPVCSPSVAIERANEWWSNNSSVVVRGYVRQSTSSTPNGHMEIVMDFTTCSSGSPMPVVRVPEKWLGHYVDLGGTAIKAESDWYIIARSIKDVE
jgi:hypothetical protein